MTDVEEAAVEAAAAAVEEAEVEAAVAAEATAEQTVPQKRIKRTTRTNTMPKKEMDNEDERNLFM